MKFVTYNVNGLRAILNKNFISTFEQLNGDIFAINESKLTMNEGDLFPFVPEGYQVYYTNSKVKKGYSGVAVFTKLSPISVHYGLEDGAYDEEGRVITLEFANFYFVACYVPNSGEELKRLEFRLEFERRLINYLENLKQNKSVIYTGDLNVAHQEIDLKNPKANIHNAGFTIEERNAFSNLLNHGFVDAFRYLYPQEIKYSWWSYRFNARARNAGWRIDYFIVSDDLREKLLSVSIHDDVYGSDHCPVSLEIDV